MELLALNSSFQPVKYLKYINLQWNRCYYEPGSFSVELPASEMTDDMCYIYTKDRPELGIIQKSEYSNKYNGKVKQVSGYFYEYKLNDKIIYPRFLSTANIETMARNIISTYKDDIPLLYLADENSPILGTSITMECTGKGIASKLYEMLKTQELSYKTVYDYLNNKINFSVWQGKDRTQDQSVNSFVTFTDRFQNIANEKTTIDSSNYKNYAVVICNGKYEDGNQIEIIVDQSGGGYKYKLYIDQTSMTYDSEEQTLQAFKDSVYQAGVEELNKHNIVVNVEFDAIDHGLTYMTDYDLGDKCDIVLDSISASFKTRIIEIDEVFKECKHSITLKFGDKIPTIYEKARIK